MSQRNPLVALKHLTSLDFVSGGRIVTAVAAGWMQGEFETLGASFEQRGKLLNAWVSAALSVFEQMPGHVEFHGTSCPSKLYGTGGRAPRWGRSSGSQACRSNAAPRGDHRQLAPGRTTPETLRAMAAELRERRPDSRVMLPISVLFEEEPRAGQDDRGRHAIAGPPEWVAEQLADYLDVGCDGFVLNLDYDRRGLAVRI